MKDWHRRNCPGNFEEPGRKYNSFVEVSVFPGRKLFMVCRQCGRTVLVRLIPGSNMALFMQGDQSWLVPQRDMLGDRSEPVRFYPALSKE